MKHLLLTLFLIVATIQTACKQPAKATLDDFKVVEYAPQYASGFEILGAAQSESTILKIINPWQGASNVEQLLFVARNEEQAPEGFVGAIVETPIRRVVCMSSSHIAMLDAVGQVDKVVGVSGIDYISNHYINEHKFCGEVRDVGYDSNLDFELIVSMMPDIVLLYGVSGDDAIVTGKLSELGIPYIYIGDYVEESPLGKAEWMVAIAELVDKRAQAEELFEGVEKRYNTLCAKAKARTVKPKVMLNTPYRDTWFMPSSKSYMVRLIEDAGGEYILKDNDGTASIPISIEDAYVMVNKADFWLNTGAQNTLEEVKTANPKFAEVPVVKRGDLYNNNRRQTDAGGSDFWESGVVAPDKVLEDLIRIFDRADGEADGQTGAELYYYKKLE